MNIFLDTSALFKLYHFEDGTTELENLIESDADVNIFISEIALVEFHSTIYKKIRMGQITPDKAANFLDVFQQDVNDFSIVMFDSPAAKLAQQLLGVYGNKGLRTLDALQLAAAVSSKQIIDLAITYDKLLKDFLTAENINTQF